MNRDAVDITLDKWKRNKFNWVEENCLLSLADYLLEVGFPDYGEYFRNSFNDENGALKHVSNFGSVENIISEFTGFEETVNPIRGDLVVVKMQETHFPGLCTGEGVAFRTEKSMLEIQKRFLTIVKAWKVEKPCHL